MPDLYTIAGIIGAILVLGAYFANQQRWLRSDSWRFPAFNLAGSCLILVSLYAQWNLPSAVVEASWAAVSAYGIAKARLHPGNSSA